MQHLQKYLKIFFTITILQIVFCLPIFANSVPEILMDVSINDDGSATITQNWQGRFDEGTENYIVIEDKNLSVSNFNVSMNGRNFAFENYWDINDSFENKKYKCGINYTGSGKELCFGISEYGNNNYTFSYDVMPLVKSYDDYDGFNFMFLNPGMNIYPSNVNLRIRLANGKTLSEENAGIWGFGYDGEIEFRDGNVIAYTTYELYDSNSVIVMLRLDKGLINPTSIKNGSFEVVREEAFRGSTYEKTLSGDGEQGDGKLFSIIFAILTLSFIITPIVCIINSIRRWLELKKFYKNADYFRDTPNKGNMSMSYALFTDFDLWNSKESNIIGAIIMQMIKDKNLEPIQERTVGFLGIEKKSTSLQLLKEPECEPARELYNIIRNAAGSDGILQENELKKYAMVHYDTLNNYLANIDSKGRNDLNKENGYKKVLGKRLKDLTEIGQKELGEIYGLRKYLDEFTLISEREISEVTIWENLLVYATLFGNAKKVLKDLKKVYPEYIQKFDVYSSRLDISDVYFRALYYSSLNGRNAARAARMARRAASGFGGHVSLGGGGGFSGGGFGGGSR